MRNLELKNLSIKPGTELRVSGVTHQDVFRFSINVGHSTENIALHFNPRFDTGSGVIVLNSMKMGPGKMKWTAGTSLSSRDRSLR
uniref:Galectin n=1 Tax=Anguilla anguilla TaxID=7936 RepID=A0A0E9PWG5_ANGAN